MKQNCGCGFILAEPRGWLLCHPTNSGNRWDFPKGNPEPGESHLHTAIRELEEETGLVLDSNVPMIDLGQHPYQNHRDLHMFYVFLPSIDTKTMTCKSMVLFEGKPVFPEMDAFVVFPKEKAISLLGNKLKAWVNSHVPGTIS